MHVKFHEIDQAEYHGPYGISVIISVADIKFCLHNVVGSKELEKHIGTSLN